MSTSTLMWFQLNTVERAAVLTARGLGTPRDLRALAYMYANQAGGFVSPAHRSDFLVRLVDDLEPAELEQVLWLDAADQAVLVRDGPIPTAADMRSCPVVTVTWPRDWLIAWSATGQATHTTYCPSGWQP